MLGAPAVGAEETTTTEEEIGVRKRNAAEHEIDLHIWSKNHHALGVNVGDLQRDNLHGPQTGPVGNAERRLVLGTGGRLQQAQHLLGREHARQLARLVDEYEMSRRLRPVEPSP
jgi:hypothetical protein